MYFVSNRTPEHISILNSLFNFNTLVKSGNFIACPAAKGPLQPTTYDLVKRALYLQENLSNLN